MEINTLKNIIMKTFTDTEKLIYSMLTENTGSHFLDSGGAYGRNWERNQKKSIKDFWEEPEQSYEVSIREIKGSKHAEIYRTVSVFHFLSGLDLTDSCEVFNSMECESWDGEFYGTSQKQCEYLDDLGLDMVSEFNTYNGESDLSQILQGVWLQDRETDDYYLLLQIHNGCDARGGYTDAKLFYTGYEMMIHEYLWEYMDSYGLMDEIEYIDEMTDYFDSTKVYKDAELDEIKEMIKNQ